MTQKEVRKMKNITKLLAVLFLTMTLGLSAATVMAYEVAYLRITGTLLPIEEEDQGGVHDILNVNINGKMRIFQLAKVKNLKANGFGKEIFRHIVPARVRFVESDDAIHNLEKPEIAGKPITITTFLYPVSRTLFITAANVVKNTPTN